MFRNYKNSSTFIEDSKKADFTVSNYFEKYKTENNKYGLINRTTNE